mgnify:CR=1 FL=1
MESRSSEDIEVVYVDGHTVETPDFGDRLGISGNFKCSICHRVLEYPSEYGATYEEGSRMNHICIVCLPSITKVIFHEP